MKTLSVIALVGLICVCLWVGFGLWTGMYSVYSIPPSKTNAEGETLLVSREAREPMFNSPAYKAPEEKSDGKRGGIDFGASKIKSKPVEDRVIVRLPFIQWAYQKSLEPQKVK